MLRRVHSHQSNESTMEIDDGYNRQTTLSFIVLALFR